MVDVWEGESITCCYCHRWTVEITRSSGNPANDPVLRTGSATPELRQATARSDHGFLSRQNLFSTPLAKPPPGKPRADNCKRSNTLPSTNNPCCWQVSTTCRYHYVMASKSTQSASLSLLLSCRSARCRGSQTVIMPVLGVCHVILVHLRGMPRWAETGTDCRGTPRASGMVFAQHAGGGVTCGTSVSNRVCVTIYTDLRMRLC